MQNTTLPSIENFKLHAKLIKENLGENIKLGQALTLLSQQYGYKNWQSLRPILLNTTPQSEEVDRELMECTIKAQNKWFEKSLEKQSHPTKKLLKYTIEGQYEDMLSVAESEEIVVAHEQIQKQMNKTSPIPILIVVSSRKVADSLKRIHYSEMQEFKKIPKETLFAQGREMGINVFDILTIDESFEISDRILNNCDIVEVPHLLQDMKSQASLGDSFPSRPGSKTKKVTQYLKDIPEDILDKVLKK